VLGFRAGYLFCKPVLICILVVEASLASIRIFGRPALVACHLLVGGFQAKQVGEVFTNRREEGMQSVALTGLDKLVGGSPSQEAFLIACCG
jgi:hypothetical protein